MELGQRIKQVRQQMGLSQRQLCGTVITRNMLSQIENGAARPSMDTLSYLAGQLGRPISFFLEENAVTSPNQTVMERARTAYGNGEFHLAAESLSHYSGPDPVFDWEKGLLSALIYMALAEQAIAENRIPYARHLLEQPVEESPYCALAELKRKLLLSRIDPDTQLPSMDEALMVKAQTALHEGNAVRAAAYLEAAEEHSTDRWMYLRGMVCFVLEEYKMAVEYFIKVEDVFAESVIPKLEHCFSELEDYKMAYHYACKQKK